MTRESPAATRREWIGLAVLALPCLLYSMDLTVLNLAVPALSADLQPSSSQLLWIIDIYGFLVAGSLITMGTLGDRIGRRRLLMIGAAAFGVASVAAAFAKSAEMLIATRAMLGIAGATLAPSTLSLIRNMFHDPRQRTVAVGVWIASYSAGAAIGPLIGGLLLEWFWWGSVFLIGVPVMLLLLAVAPALLPEYRDPDAGRLDLTSAGLSLAAVLPVIYGLKRIAEGGPGWQAALVIAGGLLAGALFVRRQRALPHPLIDLRLFQSRSFTASIAIYTVGTFVAFGTFVFISQFLQLVAGLSPLNAGIATAPFAVAFIVGSLVTPMLARRIRPARLIIAGLGVAAIGFLILTGVEAASGLPLLVVGFVVFSLGLSPVFTLANDLIIGNVPPERAGAAAGLSETGSELGGALGIAMLGSIGTAVYRRVFADSAPREVPQAQLDTANDTLGAALVVARGLPEALGTGLVEAAREAFASSLRITALLAAVIAIVTALVASRFLAPAGSPASPLGGDRSRA